MAFYVTMSAFIAANLGVIAFEMRKGRENAGRALVLAGVSRASYRR